MNGAEEIRSRMKKMRMGLDVRRQQADSEAVFAHIRLLPEYAGARCVMAYAACRGELPVERVLRDVLDSGRELAMPRCEAPGVMTARRVESLDQLVRGAYGVPEPEETCDVIPPGEIDLILAPGTAFDRQGHRLGQGGGYYDRFLPQTRAAVMGICHDAALIERIPYLPHDCAVDAVITPSGVIRCRKRNDIQEGFI